MTPENKPLSPEWLRQLRDTNASNPEQAQARREAALELAKRFGLKVSGLIQRNGE